MYSTTNIITTAFLFFVNSPVETFNVSKVPSLAFFSTTSHGKKMCSLQKLKALQIFLATFFLILYFFYLECFDQGYDGRLHTVEVFDCKPAISFACFFIVLCSSQFLLSTCRLFEVTYLGNQPSSLYKKLKIRIKYLTCRQKFFMAQTFHTNN